MLFILAPGHAYRPIIAINTLIALLIFLVIIHYDLFLYNLYLTIIYFTSLIIVTIDLLKVECLIVLGRVTGR